MDLGLTGARVAVTGGASHIGRAIVLALAAEGAGLAILDRDAAQAERTAAEAMDRGAAMAAVIPADLADHAAAATACATALERLGGIDVLVANVGWNRPAFFLDTPPEDWDQLLHVNLTACMSAVRAVLPEMVDQGHGAIIATASTAAFGEPRQGVYAAAKAGVVAFIRTIAQEYGRHGVRANLVAPGLTLPEEPDTMGANSLWQDRAAIMNDAQVDYVARKTPLRRLTKAEDIANAVLFLASDRAARQVTGQLITVSGGFAMR
ncbi:SDR family NAD(P)-dependent oxidoreductase [Marinibaculum pumilum]|uniref:SDR family NAD(P)-dependent oxidoreductase n=1 Tax=Marinibaculum pumilum TaxID=1766165 RepID=A0ABV7L5I8_9PROT